MAGAFVSPNVSEGQIDSILAGSGYMSKREVEGALTKASASLKKAKGEPVKIEKEPEKDFDFEKYPLLDVPNEMLSPEQVEFSTQFLIAYFFLGYRILK